MTAAPAPSVAVVGLGFGRAHVPAFQAVGARVVAVCQRDETAARRVAATYGVPQAYARWEDMLAAERPDIVVVATPPHLHRAIVRAAASAGAHVLCEKPLATAREDADAIVADVARSRRVGMTGFNWRFTVAMQKMRALMTEGAVGRILQVRGHWLGARWADEASPTTWRMDREKAGHGAMGDMGVHLVDLVRWTCGEEFTRVAAHAGIAYPAKPVAGTTKPTDAEDFVSLVGELSSGAQVSLVASRAAHGRNDHALEISGTRGALAYSLSREGSRWYAGALSIATGGGFTPIAVEAKPVEGTDPMDVIGRATIAPLAARLIAAMRGEGPAEPSLEDGRRAQIVLEAAREAAARRTWVEVATTSA